MKKIRLRLPIVGGRYKYVMATVVPCTSGVFAVHRALEEPTAWRITHVRSGRAVPYTYPTKVRAIKIARGLWNAATIKEQILLDSSAWRNLATAFSKRTDRWLSRKLGMIDAGKDAGSPSTK